MPLIERYILKRTAYVFLLTLGALTATLWVTQVLREIDVVTAHSQAIWVFLVMTVLALPALVQLVAPIALLIATIVTLGSMTNDGELPVISAAGASRTAVNRPILLLSLAVMIGVAFSHHVLAPASLGTLRAILTQVRANVIATLVQDGGFRAIDEELTMHIREKAADGSFRGIFVNDERDPRESLQYSASQGVLLERAGGSFLVLQDGDLIRTDHLDGDTNVVAFETYALDLSQLGAPNAAAVYRARERSTLYLMRPDPTSSPDEPSSEQIAAEVHDRITAPLYTFAFPFIALAFLGRPRTSRQDRTYAIAATVLLCFALRAGGFAAFAVARSASAAVPFMYLFPLAGILFGAYATLTDARLRMPETLEWLFDRAIRAGRRWLGRRGAAAIGA
jgi:lipopolysaccharide export system permease protein